MPESLFFNYFKDKLKFFLFWKENAWWPVVKGIAKSLDDARENAKWVRNQYSPATCDEEFIEIFGESRGISRFPFEEKEQFNTRVNEAYQYWKSAGITSTIQEWLDKLDIAATTIEYKDKGDLAHLSHLDWAEIYIQFDNFYVDANHRYYVQLLINDLKRASAKIMAGFRYQTVYETQIETSKFFIATLNRIWQYDAELLTRKFQTLAKRRPIIHVPKALTPAAPTFDDTLNRDSRDFVRTFDSGWFFDLPEDRPVKIRKAIN